VVEGDFARATPAVAGNLLILGNQSGKFLSPSLGRAAPQPARVFAVDKNTGAEVWSTQVDETQMSFVTSSAVVVNGTAIIGVASNEELVAAFVPPPYWRWQFRGSAVGAAGKSGIFWAFRAKDGKLVWSYPSGGPCNAGPSIADGMVYWGSGTFISPGGPHKLYAFGL